MKFCNNAKLYSNICMVVASFSIFDQPPLPEAQGDVDRMSIISGNSGFGGFDREDRYSGNEGVVSLPHWMWIAAGSCRIDPVQPPSSWYDGFS